MSLGLVLPLIFPRSFTIAIRGGSEFGGNDDEEDYDDGVVHHHCLFHISGSGVLLFVYSSISYSILHPATTYSIRSIVL